MGHVLPDDTVIHIFSLKRVKRLINVKIYVHCKQFFFHLLLERTMPTPLDGLSKASSLNTLNNFPEKYFKSCITTTVRELLLKERKNLEKLRMRGSIIHNCEAEQSSVKNIHLPVTINHFINATPN